MFVDFFRVGRTVLLFRVEMYSKFIFMLFLIYVYESKMSSAVKLMSKYNIGKDFSFSVEKYKEEVMQKEQKEINKKKKNLLF